MSRVFRHNEQVTEVVAQSITALLAALAGKEKRCMWILRRMKKSDLRSLLLATGVLQRAIADAVSEQSTYVGAGYVHLLGDDELVILRDVCTTLTTQSDAEMTKRDQLLSKMDSVSGVIKDEAT